MIHKSFREVADQSQQLVTYLKSVDLPKHRANLALRDVPLKTDQTRPRALYESWSAAPSSRFSLEYVLGRVALEYQFLQNYLF
jgi:hypothetical protein